VLGETNHYKSFFKKEDAEIFLKELPEKFQRDRKNRKENRQTLQNANEEFLKKYPDLDFWTSEEYDKLLESGIFHRIECYPSTNEEEYLYISEEIVH
jgi:hypothetical protein